MKEEKRRLEEDRLGQQNWRRWGPYLSERQWGTVREDYSAGGNAWQTPEAYQELLKLIPYKRIGEVDDIGRAAVWLASDDADYVHGTSLFVDGRMTLYPGFKARG